MMNNIVNTHQAEAWNGYEGTHWADHHERYNTLVGGMNSALFEAAAIRPDHRVLDVGCGTGQTTRLAAAKARRGSATGIDLSLAMLDRARDLATAEGIGNVAFEFGDAQVHPFPAATYDVAISRGGVMFFDDHVAAFANIARALRPDGRVALLTPQDTDRNSDSWRVFAGFNALLAEHAPPARGTGSDPAPRMATLTDPARVRELLTVAGFAGMQVRGVESPVHWGADVADAAEFILDTARLRMDLSAVPADVLAEARAHLHSALAPHETAAGGVVLPGAVWITTATRP